MQDIIVDDRRQLSAKAVSREQKANPQRKKKRGFFKYIIDLSEKSIIVAALLCINFMLFVNAGSYNMLLGSPLHFTNEVIYIISGIAIFSAILMYLISFSRFLQNLLAAVVIGLFILALFNQFALFDKNSILLNSLGSFFNGSAYFIIENYSHYIIAGSISFIFLIIFSTSNRITIGYFMGTLLFIFGGIAADAYLNHRPHQNFNLINEKIIPNSKEDGKKFIFIAMPSLTSYNNLKDFADEKEIHKDYNAKITKALDVMLGFYTKNKFTLYANAYTKEENAFINFTQLLNPTASQKDTRENISKNVALQKYWNLSSLSDERIYLKNNHIFDGFIKNDYQLKVYQSHGIELCTLNNLQIANKCIQKANLPISFANNKLNTLQKTALLFTQWLESTNLISNYSSIYKTINTLNNTIDFPSAGFSTKDFYVHNSLETLDILAKDIKKDKGNTAYFAVIDMPANLYIYDQFCAVKPTSQWISPDNIKGFIPNANIKKREAYAEQVTCLFGKLENFIQNLSNEKMLDNTVIILQGLNGTKELTGQTTDYYNQMKSSRQVTTAIYDPLQADFNLNERVCESASIFSSYLFKKDKCTELSDINLSKNSHNDLLNKFKNDAITNDNIINAQINFINWYQDWANANHVDNNAFSASEIHKEAVTKVIEKETSVEKQPKNDIIPLTRGEEPAVRTDSLPLAKEKKDVKKEAPLPLVAPKVADKVAQPQKNSDKTIDKVKKVEQLKAASKTTAKKTNVVSHDVIPPFLEDDNN